MKILLLGILLLGVLWVLGPREQVVPLNPFDSSKLPDDLESYLVQSEIPFSNITAGVQKRIVWAGQVGKKSQISLVYIHGFSATSEEIRPVPDDVAAELGANLFYTRLTGHGQDGAALADATAGDWINDVAEAVEIGRRIGDRVLILSTSTGGTLGAIAASDPAMSKNVAGFVSLSPNFGINNPASVLLTQPWARYWVPLVAGAERSFESQNAQQATYWTHTYPTRAVLPMAALVRYAVKRDYSEVVVPALFILSDKDQVVRPDITRKVAARWGRDGARVVTVSPQVGDDPYAHVIAGNILSPSLNDPVTEAILKWVSDLELAGLEKR